MTGEEAPGRTIIRVSGTDRESFLQGLVTNDLRKLRHGAVYAALLTPQGKYLADFFLYPEEDAVLLDVADPLADGLLRRLSLYRLRADISLERTGLHVHRGLGPAPAGAFADPRHPAMGWRSVADAAGADPAIDWNSIRVAELIPETLVELLPDESYILEMGFERLNGVDFRKGCYVGQEVTARMKHKTELRKGLALVEITGEAAPGTSILADGKEAGQVCTRSGNNAIAYLRFDRAMGEMRAGEAIVRLAEPQRGS
ncbi:folate-binding protein [Frigidibacter sp. RF13]|uniref:CAF17-like 4Fe-4S cluster assembly/insertion protein YgfZ n=1 Tax=Frigidibacter sp. RF13 TaxID=2997340 RepID=UPI00226F38A1|nr:folate-binding protein [Frigidibacter sp. RF13]MCY1128227.1 folate-binding protein [Frigidibacter sp. RF13]